LHVFGSVGTTNRVVHAESGDKGTAFLSKNKKNSGFFNKNCVFFYKNAFFMYKIFVNSIFFSNFAVVFQKGNQ